MPSSRGKPSLTSIANDLGVSAKTVSNAFRQPHQLSAQLREQILGHAAMVGYSGPDPLARAFKERASRLVGVVYGNPLSHAFEDGAYIEFLSGVAEILEEAGYGLTLIPAGRQHEARPLNVQETVMDAAIAYSLAHTDDTLRTLALRQIPYVVVDQPRIDGVPWIGIDDRDGMRLISRHLRDLGHTNVGVVSFAMNEHAQGEVMMLDDLPDQALEVTHARLQGVIDTFGDVVNTIPVVHCYGSSDAVGRQGLETLLQRHPTLTAVMFLGDRMAEGGLEMAQEKHIRVPDDLSITGFDGVPHLSTLTTVRQPHGRKGREAARRILSLLAQQSSPMETILPVELQVKESTAAPSSEALPVPRKIDR